MIRPTRHLHRLSIWVRNLLTVHILRYVPRTRLEMYTGPLFRLFHACYALIDCLVQHKRAERECGVRIWLHGVNVYAVLMQSDAVADAV